MLLLITCTLLFYGYTQTCPLNDLIAPCRCRSIFMSNVMTCRNIFSPDELMKPITAVAKEKSQVEILAIINSSLQYIPNSMFNSTSFQKVYFINSGIMSLSDTDVAFEGLENTLTEIRATEARYIADWNWNQLRNLKALELIDITNIELGSISEPFPVLKTLKFLGITNAEISFVVQYAFASLNNLKILNLKGNEISELNRNMFPEPAYKLLSLDFSNNKLSHLPDDIFRNMLNLEHVILDRNQFTTLDRNVFSWALKNLYELGMFGNKFACDCRLKWMAGGLVPIIFSGVCDSPSILKGKPLRLLQLEEATCQK